MRLAQVATCDCKDLQRMIIALNEAHTEGLDCNAVLYSFGDSWVYKNLPVVRRAAKP